MDEKKPTLDYGTPERRQFWTPDIIFFAAVCLVIICIALGVWCYFFKPDLDRGIWP